MVSAHELTAGQQLPAERVLAERFQVSRNVVREALRSLAAMNVLEIRHGIGVFVASLDIDSLVEPLEFALTLEKGTFESLTEARLLLEPGIAALAAARASKRDIAVLRRLLEDSEASVAEPTLFLATDIALHNHVVGMSRNPVLARVVHNASGGREYAASTRTRRIGIGQSRRTWTSRRVETPASRSPPGLRARTNTTSA